MEAVAACPNPPMPRPESSGYWHDRALGIDLSRARVGSHRFRRHSHDTFIIAATEAGGLRGIVNGISHVLRPGAVLIVQPDQPHQGEAASAAGWSYRAFYPEARVVSSLVEEVTGRQFDVPAFPTVIEDVGLSERLLRAHRIIERSNVDTRQNAYLVALNALASWTNTYEPRRPLAWAPSSRVDLVKDFILSCYAEPITVSMLARVAGCGVFQLMRAFERQVGVPVHMYVMQVRLKRACALLAQGEPSAAVAAAVGFVDQSHLIRRFRQAYGVTPGSYVRDSR